MTMDRTVSDEIRRAVLVTGTSTGIGRACAMFLARSGYSVFAGVRREQDAATWRELAVANLNPILLDVTDQNSARTAVEQVAKAVGSRGLAGLVNNAGVAVGGPLEFVPIEELRRQLEVNVVGTIAITQACIPLLRTGRGRVVTIGSVAGLVGMPLMGPYCASKFALEALTDVLRMELAPWGIHVSIVEPSSVATPIWDKSINFTAKNLEETRPEMAALYGRQSASVRAMAERSGRRGIPAEKVAQTVEHALSARVPRTRYPVGRPVEMTAMRVLSILPDRWRDRIMRLAVLR